MENGQVLARVPSCYDHFSGLFSLDREAGIAVGRIFECFIKRG